jgi:hypothetical protein
MLVSRNLQSAELAELNGHGNETENMSSIRAFNLTLDLGPNVQAKVSRGRNCESQQFCNCGEFYSCRSLCVCVQHANYFSPFPFNQQNLMSELYNVDPVFGSGSGSGSGNQEGDAYASDQQFDGTCTSTPLFTPFCLLVSVHVFF